MSAPIPDTRALFRPLTDDVVKTLRSLSARDWDRRTLARAWRVRDVVAHMLDTALRRLSYHRDGSTPPPFPGPVESERDLAAHINELNASWVRVSSRFSPRVLVDLYSVASAQLCDFIESLSANEPPLFPVSWAGDAGSDGLLDVGREFTEIWHHAAQVRDAVGAGPFPDPRWLRAVLAIALQALPHAYRDVAAEPGASLTLQIAGSSGGTWTLRREHSCWRIFEGDQVNATARALMTDDVAWRLFFNALADAPSAVQLHGNQDLARHLLDVRSVIV